MRDAITKPQKYLKMFPPMITQLLIRNETMNKGEENSQVQETYILEKTSA